MGLREVTLSWDRDDSTTVKFKVERAETAQGPFQFIRYADYAKGSFSDRNGLKDGSMYYYRVIPLNSQNVAGKTSAVVESMTAPPPSPPTQLAGAAPSSRCITLSWVAPRAEGVTHYRVERSPAVNPPQWQVRGESNLTSFREGGRSDSDFEDSTAYLYRVSAINRFGAAGDPSPPVSVKTLPPPAPVAEFKAQSHEVRCVPLTWRASPEEDIKGYEIERAEGDGSFAPLVKTGHSTPFFHDGKASPRDIVGTLKDNQLYRYRIRPYNQVGSYGAWSETIIATTHPPPPAPQGVTCGGGLPRAVEVKWEISPDEKIRDYCVECSECGADSWRKVGYASGRDTTRLLDRAGAPENAPAGRLKDGTAYRYRVAAINSGGVVSPWSAVGEATTKPAPLAPVGLGTTDDEPAKVVLVWEPNPEVDVVAYAVEARAADGSRWRKVAQVAGCVAEEKGLAAGERRIYRIKAIDADTLESAWSPEASGAARPLPASPGALSAKWEGDAATVTWHPPQEGMAEYRIYRKGLFSAKQFATSQTPQASLDAATVGKRITVYVTAVDAAGLESRPSESIKIQAPAAAGGLNNETSEPHSAVEPQGGVYEDD